MPAFLHSQHATPEIQWCWEIPGGLDVPHELCCPITWQLLYEPVLLHGDVFERAALETWLRRKPRHPLRADVAAHPDEVQPVEDFRRLCCAFAEQHALRQMPLYQLPPF